MDNRKTFLAAAFAAIAIAASAMPGERGPTPRGEGAGGRGHHVQQSGTHLPRMQHSGPRRSAFSSPNDPFHDTYKKNTGEIRREAPKPVNNLHAKISAARAEAIKFELERERAHKSPISCWSNFGTLSTVAVAQSAPAAVEQKSITIVNSNVTINK
jgi:hypothetical protein